MAAVLRCPVWLLSCQHEGRGYHARIEAMTSQVVLSRQDRQAGLDAGCRPVVVNTVVDPETAEAWGHHSMPVPRSFLEPIADGAPRLLVHGVPVATAPMSARPARPRPNLCCCARREV